MSNKLLLPHSFKRPGWILLVPATVLGILFTVTGYEPGWLNVRVFSFFGTDVNLKSNFFTLTYNNISDEIIALLFITGAVFVGFSKEKREDEYIANLRLSSLLWAVYANYMLLFIAIIFVYDLSFLTVMVYNMFTVLLIFVTRFNYILYRNSKLPADEK